MRRRWVHLTALVAGAAAVLFPARRAEPQGPGPQSVPAVMHGCHLCHAEYVKEWADSYHGKAWTDEIFQGAKAKAPKEKQASCNPCHIPNPTHVTGLGKPPTTRAKNQNEGVSCVSCHQIPNASKPEDIGTIVGPYAPDANIKSHPNRHMKEMETDIRICASCHGTDRDHNQVDSWKGSVYEKEGRTCQSCHMPEFKRAVFDKKGALPRTAHKHSLPGAHEPGFVRKAALLDVSVAGGKVTAKITNDGAGHNFPGGGEREAVLIVTVVGADGKEAAAYRELFDLRTKDNRIKPKETRTLEFEAKAASGTVKARLIYKLTPEWDEAKATVVAEKEVKF
jgi:nitrate/TMAO reductase-like tetraheme cytochrome c subunit